jgi:hypothetical protein
MKVGTPRYVGQVGDGLWGATALHAAETVDIAVNLKAAVGVASRASVQAIDVLSDEGKAVRESPLELHQRMVCGIGFRLLAARPPPEIPGPDQFRVR